jgi:hypothetical protein
MLLHAIPFLCLRSQLEVVQAEVGWRRRAALFAAAEYFGAAGSVTTSRRRRAAWLKAMRATRAGVKALMAAQEAIIFNVMQSLDGGEVQASA